MSRSSRRRAPLFLSLFLGALALDRFAAAGRAGPEGDSVYVVGHRSPDIDSVASAIAYAGLKQRLGMKGAVPAVAGEIDRVSRFALERFGFAEPRKLAGAAGRRVILVDHNEASQAVEGLLDAELLEVVDHHRLGGLSTPRTIPVHIEPVGSTCTIVAELYEKHSVPLSRETAGLLLAAVLCDTHLFRSPTSTEKDRAVASSLARISGEGHPGFLRRACPEGFRRRRGGPAPPGAGDPTR